MLSMLVETVLRAQLASGVAVEVVREYQVREPMPLLIWEPRRAMAEEQEGTAKIQALGMVCRVHRLVEVEVVPGRH
jgi:hypothetical protein